MTDPRRPLRPPSRRWLVAVAAGGALLLTLLALLGKLPLVSGLAAAALLAFAPVAVGSLAVGSGLLARPVIGASGTPGLLSLTFDDGPHPEGTPRILELLAARGHRATFFVVGRAAEAHPALLGQIAAAGHELGNHSHAHAWHLPFARPARVAEELRRVQDAIARATGKVPRLFRPPAGAQSPRLVRGVRLAGLELVAFSARGLDHAPGRTARAAFARLRPALRPGAILLLHDAPRSGQTHLAAEVLPLLLDELERLGLRSVPVSELVGLDAETEAATRDAAPPPPTAPAADPARRTACGAPAAPKR
ncbi:MAG: polysaccharide deacetylase family protein [Deltaproteobacteria bacterium]|nr:polysaccharide deacetylase family protein [Deltaproteobacteria bacterium]